MITISRLEKNGNFGNQLFRIAAVLSFAKKLRTESCFPNFKWESHFNLQLNDFHDLEYESINEEHFYFYNWKLLENINYDLYGYFQSEKYFDVPLIKEKFKFSFDFLQNLNLNKFNIFDKRTILISVRRGDFVNHPHYFQLNYRYYILALINNFPEWKSSRIVFASDDIQYCKYHFSFIKNAVFLENLSAVEQLALGSKCDDFIISNSTFSWWIAWLGEKDNTKIIRPIKNFRGDFAEKNDDKDFFPERWIAFDDAKFRFSNEFHILRMKGFIFESIVDFKYHYFAFLKSFKNFIKKIVKW